MNRSLRRSFFFLVNFFLYTLAFSFHSQIKQILLSTNQGLYMTKMTQSTSSTPTLIIQYSLYLANNASRDDHLFMAVIVQLSMNKKSENNISTERILKSKYLDKDKQKTIPLIKHKPSVKKIKLTDLCPEQKLKVGELIKTLDERRADNQHLTSQLQQITLELQQLKIELETSRIKFQNLQQHLQEKQGEIASLNEGFDSLQEKLKQQYKKNADLSRTAHEYFVKLQEGQRERKTISLQTESPSLHQSTQVTVSLREIGMQTDKQQHERDLFYRPHSKSFEKIMKAPISVELPKTSLHNSSSYGTSKSKANSQSNEGQTENGNGNEDELGELKEKWDKLKMKHQRGRVDWHDSPHSFHVSEAQKESSKKKGSKMDEMDEVALNRMLRLKDFSASKLMRAGQEPPSQAKPQKQSPEVNYLKSPYFNRIESDSNPNTRALKPTRVPQEINFYESGLFEVNSSRD